QVPTLEESVYDRHTQTLTTYTRNVTKGELLEIHERCIYQPVFPESKTIPAARLLRSIYISAHVWKMSAPAEMAVLSIMKKSTARTVKGLTEKLEERYGLRSLHNLAEKHKLSQKLREKLEKLKEIK
ncbi:hypothetical protein PMAYCL1PPCAC_14499, partial [Pristionchus mayeri]